MSVKDIDDLKQKVFYIDRAVNPYFNIQIMKLYQMNSQLSTKVQELEKRISELGGESVSQNNTQEEVSEKVPEKATKKKNTKKTEVTNDIRTITLE
tara:strand:+ start:41 stop:328 length:288 start_codon:yes stop_codon:yes gene_type:complete